jgi:hypothetical protein
MKRKIIITIMDNEKGLKAIERDIKISGYKAVRMAI